MPTPLELNAAQIAVMTSLDTLLQTLFLNGASDLAGTPLTPPIAALDPRYSSELTAAQQQSIHDGFKGPFAALLVALGLPTSTGVTATIPLAKLTVGGFAGSLTFTNGLLTSYISPS